MSAQARSTAGSAGGGGQARKLGGSRGVGWARAEPLLIAAVATGLIARIVFWLTTDRRIDDALITVKHAKNVADGVGLTHHLGEGGPVHGFTSALSALIPIPGELVGDGGGFLVLRLVSLAAFVLAAVYAYRIAGDLGLGPWPTGFALAYLALDQDQVFYGMAGMETQIATAVLLAGVYYVLVEDYAKSAIALGLAPLARPDFLLWVAPAYLLMAIRDRRRALRAAAISASILAPWLIFTTLYYGSPVPNTITAKSAFFGPDFPSLTDIGGWLTYAGDLLSRHQHDWQLLAPFYERVFVIDTPVPYVLLKLVAWAVAALAVVGAIASWRRRSFRPAIAFAGLYVIYRVVFLDTGYNEWYGVPVIAVIVLLAATGLDRLTIARPRLVVVPAVALALAYAIQLPFTTPIEARIQHQIEDRVRVPMGEYLAQVVGPGESFASESAGYVGYDTNATLYDFPGLTSPTVIAALDDGAPHALGIYGIAQTLHPDWLVLRSNELQYLRQSDPATAAMYTVARQFSVSVADSSLDFGGLAIFNVDRDFVVLRTKRDH